MITLDQDLFGLIVGGVAMLGLLGVTCGYHSGRAHPADSGWDFPAFFIGLLGVIGALYFVVSLVSGFAAGVR